MSWPSTWRLVLGQVRYQLLTFWRTPVALFFTIMLPLIMLLLFNSLFGDAEVDIEGGGQWPARQFYTGGLAVFTAVSATYTNLSNQVPIRREEGVLKRWRGTPLPTSAYIAGFIGSAIVLAFAGTLLMLGIGVVAYDLEVDAAKMPAAAVTFVIGVATFAAWGMAVAALVPSASSAAAVANATILPLAFVSNVFIVTDDAPEWITTVGDIFPLKPFVVSFQDAFNPFIDAPAFQWTKLGYIALWGLVGLVIAIKNFTWEPTPGGQSTRGRRAARQAAMSETG
ncbi:MAG: ABC transporter permease [Ilumatobacter sp.]|uniref:ABC transporter permease n=1 Tax=Ilumatobacter sp. TaxID=1967498 RepID=UPI002616C8BC|nr:ABC transporter permease [Ilumatobacter sp.]MDJ0769077.1 ABC transporter permease [Ilumatobacter sp.]